MKGRPTNSHHGWCQGSRTHPFYENIEIILKIPKISIKHTFEEINVITIDYAMFIILHKRRIGNNKSLPTNTQPP